MDVKIKLPDYVGAWDCSLFIELYQYAKKLPGIGPYFHLFIDRGEDEKLQNGKISGLIKDVFGDAFFDGTLSKDTIKFTKKYTSDAIQNGGKKEPLVYSGIRVTQNYQEFITGMITTQSEITPKTFIMKRILS